MVALAALSRRDVLCAGYIIFLAIMVFHVNLEHSARSLQWWSRLRVYNGIVLLIHILWVLPAMMIPWNTGNSATSALSLAEVFGLRFGLGMVLRTTDPRISAWSFEGNGIVYDVFLYILLAFHAQLTTSEFMQRVSLHFSDTSIISSARAEEAEQQQAGTQQQVFAGMAKSQKKVEALLQRILSHRVDGMGLRSTAYTAVHVHPELIELFGKLDLARSIFRSKAPSPEVNTAAAIVHGTTGAVDSSKDQNPELTNSGDDLIRPASKQGVNETCAVFGMGKNGLKLLFYSRHSRNLAAVCSHATDA